MVNLLKKEKVEFGVDRARLTKDLEDLDKAHKALESEFSSLSLSHEQLQTRLTKYDVASSSNSSYDHTNVIEESARLKAKQAKPSSSQGKNTIDGLLRNQRTNNGKEGIGYVSKTKKKAKTSHAKEKNVVGGNASKGIATRNDFAGLNNPNYVLVNDYYGNVYAQYVGPFDGYIAWSIWVPKTLVANKRGPIGKWVPKNKT